MFNNINKYLVIAVFLYIALSILPKTTSNPTNNIILIAVVVFVIYAIDKQLTIRFNTERMTPDMDPSWSDKLYLSNRPILQVSPKWSEENVSLPPLDAYLSDREPVTSTINPGRPVPIGTG